jgi:hypothetical protein
VFAVEHYFVSKSFVAVREAFSNVHPDKEVPTKKTVHRLATKCWDSGNVSVKCAHRGTKNLKLQPTDFK